MNLPKSIQDVVESFEMLPGIGPRTAQRLAFYLLRLPEFDVQRFAKTVGEIKEKTQVCKSCFNVSEDEVCDVCKNLSREHRQICVVESPLDVLALEKSGYKGIYHVLHGVINPLAGIGPDEIFMNQLFIRLDNILQIDEINVLEVIIATGTSLEGESTAMYIHKEVKKRFESRVKITRIGKGLPIGADIEFADEQTLNDAMQSRMNY